MAVIHLGRFGLEASRLTELGVYMGRIDEDENKLLSKDRGPLKKLLNQILGFGAVGVIAFLIDYSTLMLLSQAFNVEPVLAAGVSYVLSTVFNYFASMKYVFCHKEGLSRKREFAIFVILSTIGLAINEILMMIGTILFGVSAAAVTVTKVAATAIVMVYNFITRKLFLDAD